MNCSAEDRLVLLFSRVNLEEDVKKEIKELLRNDLDWPSIFKKCELNDILQLLYIHLNSFKQDGLRLPAEGLLKQLEGAYYTNLARNALIYNELRRILKACKEKGIQVILLKGAALAKIIYQDIALRPMSDIDILVEKSQLGEVNGILNSLGYSSPANYSDVIDNFSLRSSLNTYLYKKQHPVSSLVHLHWHLINSTWPIYNCVCAIDMDRIWAQAERIRLDGAQALILAPHHLLIYLSEHAFNHSFDRLILFCDIWEAIRHYRGQLDWDLLLEETMRFNLTKPVYFCLYCSGKLLRAEIPSWVMDRLRPRRLSVIERRFLCLVSGNTHTRYLSYFAYLSMQKGVTGKIRFVWNTIFPSPGILAHNYRIKTSQVKPRHYLMRFIRRQL